MPTSNPKKILVGAIGLFLCLLITQISFNATDQAASSTVTDSQKKLIQNAAVPIFLSENRGAAISQLESLIQDTDIKQVKMYSTDQKQIAEVLNNKAPASEKPNVVDSFPIAFQGTLAGSIQVEMVDTAQPRADSISLFSASLKSLIITLAAIALYISYLIGKKYLPLATHKERLNIDVLEPNIEPEPGSQGNSLLLYLYLALDQDAKDNEAAVKECVSSFYQKLDRHIALYGGKVISLSNERIICRMPTGLSSNDYQQAMIFAWGIARTFLFKYEHKQYALNVKTFLYQTSIVAKSRYLFRAISEVGANKEAAIANSRKSAHVSSHLRDSLDQIEYFALQTIDKELGVLGVTSKKNSLETLWQKQEAMVSKVN